MKRRKRMTKKEHAIVDYNWAAKRGVRERFLKQTFTPRIAKLLTTLDDDADIDGDNSYYIFGQSFYGKTILAAHLMLQQHKDFHYSVEWKDFHMVEREAPTYCLIPITDLYLELKASFTVGAAITETDIVNKYSNIDVLCLDDLNATRTTEWSSSILYTILNRRYSNEKQTIFTSNLSLEELLQKGFIDERIFSRIEGMCYFIEKENWKDC